MDKEAGENRTANVPESTEQRVGTDNKNDATQREHRTSSDEASGAARRNEATDKLHPLQAESETASEFTGRDQTSPGEALAISAAELRNLFAQPLDRGAIDQWLQAYQRWEDLNQSRSPEILRVLEEAKRSLREASTSNADLCDRIDLNQLADASEVFKRIRSFPFESAFVTLPTVEAIASKEPERPHKMTGRRQIKSQAPAQDSARRDRRLSGATGTGGDGAMVERARVRSAWLDQRLSEHPTVESDTDIVKNGGPSYNTIRRYRSGRLSTRDRYVRKRIAAVFNCEITEVPE
jgi:hypothetical protein